MQKPDLSVVIVNWNTRELLRDCLSSVFSEPTGLQLEVFVADNASTDGSAQMVREAFPQVHLILNNQNLGFAAANNAVFPLCRSDKILLLNSDTAVKGDALRVLSDFLDQHPEAGAVAPKLEQSDAGVDILGCGRQVTLRTSINHWLFLARLFPKTPSFEGIYYYADVHDDRTREVEWVSGASMLVRRAVIEDIGPLSERWFMYGEDHEWCARMVRAGWKIFHIPTAMVEHRHGASLEKNDDVSLLPLKAGRELFIQLNQPSRWQLWVHDIVRVLGFAIRAAGYFVKSLLVFSASRNLWARKARIFLTYTRASFQVLGQLPAD